MAKKVVLMEFEGNSNIGLYMFVNDKFCILGKEVDEIKKKEIENVLQVPIYHANVLGTDLIGVFVSGDDNFLLIPDMYDYEKEVFEKIAKEHSIELLTLKDKANTYGNNICFGNKKILINPNYSKNFKQDLGNQTKYEVIDLDIEDLENAGAITIFKNNKYFLSQEVNEKHVKKIVNEIGGVGTINAGSNYISSGVVGNSNGVILGSLSTTVEIQNIVEGLDYI